MQITAAIARAKNAPLSLEEVSLAEPRADEVLVKLVAAGICHTDISMRDHIIYPVPHPVVLGHEGAGIVERIGAGVTRLAPGDPAILTSASCGHCPSCDSWLPIYFYEFNDRNFGGTRIDGSSPLSKGSEVIHYYQGQSSFATHAVIRERSVVKVPKEAPLEMLAPLGCGIMTGAGAVINSLGAGIDDSVAVFGTGSVGLSAIMAAKLVGAGAIIAVDLVDSRLALARELGATHAINPQTQSAPEAIRRILPLGVDFIVDTTANANVLRDAVALLAPRGTLGMVGGAPKGLEFPLDVEHVLTGGRTVPGIIEGDANPDVFLPKLVDLFVKGKFPIDRLVTFYPFARINDAIADALSGKVVKPILRF
ncbi:MAG TPA: NAD(P)-dependent alcohol dehydrogenase [Xanthobacteraceae bacterium]|nr:NAD(P)-dependent alcohol dehydrogenase [Xanthobacteraceae bacterium]